MTNRQKWSQAMTAFAIAAFVCLIGMLLRETISADAEFFWYAIVAMGGFTIALLIDLFK